MRKQIRPGIALIGVLLMAALVLGGCGAAKAAIPEGFVGEWKCEDVASDGKTDTSFYAMTIKEDGHFSMYDFAAGNPGISGVMKNDTGSSVDCEFDMEDFDVPFCWRIDTPEATLDYELEKDTLRLGFNGVWMVFHREGGEEKLESLNSVMSFVLPPEFTLDREYPYEDEAGNPIVEQGYTGERGGYFSAGIFSYKGRDCLGDGGKVDVADAVDDLEDVKQIDIGGEKGSLGMQESDDTPGMAAVAYVQHGDYAFTFRFTNGDEQVTKKQKELFEKILGTAMFRGNGSSVE